MNDSLVKLLNNIEPKIFNIQDNRIEIKSLSEVYNTITEIVSLGENSYLDILDYYDQEFIIKAIKISNRDVDKSIDEYKSCRYLLKNRDPNLHELPQYKIAIHYMENIFQYLYELYKNIKLEYETKKEALEIQELLNKYYIILKQNNIFILDIDEFLTFLNLCDFNIDDKLNILIFINKCNLKNYLVTNDIMISNDICLSDITTLLNDNQTLLKSFKDTIPIQTNFNINEISEESYELRKVILLHQIKDLYDLKKYDEIIEYYLEFQKIVNYEKEFQKQKTKFSDNLNKKLVFVLDNGVSLVRGYLNNCNSVYKSCIYKNLLDLEHENELLLPSYYLNGINLYIKDEFIIKTVYTYLDDGYILIIGILDENESIENFVNKNKELLNKSLKNIDSQTFDDKERDLILKNIKLEDLVLTIDLNTLDVRMEDKDAR